MAKPHPGVKEMLDVSTVHITKKDNIQLVEWSRAEDPPLLIASYEYGWIIYIPDAIDGIESEGFGLSESFAKIVALCRGLDIDYLQLDSDGIEHDELNRHEDW